MPCMSFKLAQSSRFATKGDQIQAPSSEMGIAGSVDKAVYHSVYREPHDSVDQEPKVRSIGNQNRAQTRRSCGIAEPLTILTTILIGLLLTLHASARLRSAMGRAVAARFVTPQVHASQLLARD